MKTIRELRMERGWTQFDLAIEVGVHPQTVYLWESGRRTPLVPQMRKLGELFGLSSDDIVLEARPAPGGSRRRPSAAENPSEGTNTNDQDGKTGPR